MAGEAQLFLNTIKSVVQQMMQGASLTDCVFGTVVKETPLEIKVDSFADVLEEDDLILTNAVKDHFVDIEVAWETVEDNYLQDFQQTYNSNVSTYNSHRHPGCKEGSTGAASDKMQNGDTTHLHDIKGRKKICIYNGLKVGETVLLLRRSGGQQYVVWDRVSEHITSGEWTIQEGQ